MATRREIQEGLLRQGVDERIAYVLTTTPWGGTPTDVVVTVFDVTGGARTDVTATVTTGAAVVDGDEITLPAILSLTDGNLYRVEVKWSCSGNVFEAYAMLRAEL